MVRALICLVLAASTLLAWPNRAEAAESYDNCTGFINSLPAAISSQGVWCLSSHLSIAITSGNAIAAVTTSNAVNTS